MSDNILTNDQIDHKIQEWRTRVGIFNNSERFVRDRYTIRRLDLREWRLNGVKFQDTVNRLLNEIDVHGRQQFLLVREKFNGERTKVLARN